MRRREFLGLAGATLVAGMSSRARAADWPERPVKLILPYAPGGATDLIGRPWADKLAQAFGHQFVIENRGGASGIIGTEAAAKAAPDGYTLLLTPNAPLSVQPTLRRRKMSGSLTRPFRLSFVLASVNFFESTSFGENSRSNQAHYRGLSRKLTCFVYLTNLLR